MPNFYKGLYWIESSQHEWFEQEYSTNAYKTFCELQTGKVLISRNKSSARLRPITSMVSNTGLTVWQVSKFPLHGI